MHSDEGSPTGSSPGPDDISLPASPPSPLSDDIALPPALPRSDGPPPVGESYWQPRRPAPVPAPPAPRATRSRRGIAVAAALVVVVGAAVGVVVFATGTNSAEAAVLDAVTSTLADKTAAVHIDTTVHSPSIDTTVSGTGDVDFTQDALDLNLTVDQGGNQIPVQTLYLGGTVYEDLPGLSQLLPGKSWLSIDLGSPGLANRDTPGGLSSAGNPTALLKLLETQGNTVTALGSSTVDGVSVQGYKVVLDPAAVKAEIAQDHLPAWISSVVSQLNLGAMSEDVYIDGSGMLRRFSTSVTESEASVGTISVQETLDFSDYGTSFTVSPPPASAVVDFSQFLQAAEASLGSGSPSAST
jgi:hypothetical protein